MIINGLRIPHPATFPKRERERPRASVAPSYLRVKPTVTIPPSNPTAKHLMPIVVVAAAIGSIAAGVTAVAAATTMIGTVLAGAMIVGGAATLIGVATGNQNLVKYGSILSAVGGIGTMGLNLLSGAESAGASAASVAGDAQMNPVLDGAADYGGMAGAGDVQMNPMAGGALDTGAAPAAAPSGILADPATASTAATNAATPTAPATTTNTPFTASGTDAYAPGENPTPFTTATPNTPSTVSQTPMGFFNDVGKWVNQNKELTKVATDAIGGYAKAKAAEPLQDAQIGNLNANTDATAKATALKLQRADWGRGISKPLSAYMGR